MQLVADAGARIGHGGLLNRKLEVPSVALALAGPMAKGYSLARQPQVRRIPVHSRQLADDRAGHRHHTGALACQLRHLERRVDAKLRLHLTHSSSPAA